jgi:TRAP-type mannitol/chloroaromatic compound transport system permease small subunit
MGALAGFVRFAEAVNDYVGRIVAWLTFATVLICATVVFIRYALQSGFIWMQELYVWTHAAAFMLGAGYTLMANKHVRVDIIYARASPKTKAWLDLISTFVFLFPWVILLAYFAWPYVLQSWELWETSSQVGGMPGLYVMKTIILAFAGLMFLQGLAICARSILILNDQGHLAPPRPVAALGE